MDDCWNMLTDIRLYFPSTAAMAKWRLRNVIADDRARTR